MTKEDRLAWPGYRRHEFYVDGVFDETAYRSAEQAWGMKTGRAVGFRVADPEMQPKNVKAF